MEDEGERQETFATEVKVFNKWASDELAVTDVSLIDYIGIKHKYAVFVPHTAGRYQTKRFRKTACPIVERLVNAMMRTGRNNGKKMMAIRIVKHALDIIHLMTGKNPLQVLADAVMNAGPREDSTRIGSAGVVRRQAVDVSPLRRVNQAMYLMTTGARNSAAKFTPAYAAKGQYVANSGGAVHVAKREADAEADPALLYNNAWGYTGYPYAATTYGAWGYNPYNRVVALGKREAEAEADPALLYRSAFGYAPSVYTGYTAGYTGYPYASTGYPTASVYGNRFFY